MKRLNFSREERLFKPNYEIFGGFIIEAKMVSISKSYFFCEIHNGPKQIWFQWGFFRTFFRTFGSRTIWAIKGSSRKIVKKQ